MFEESKDTCETDCQCSGLITDSFRINSGNSATKRRREEATSANFKTKMFPHAINFNTPLSPLKSPHATPSKRRVLGEIQNSPLHILGIPKKSPTIQKSPLAQSSIHNKENIADEENIFIRRVPQNSPLSSRRQFMKRSSSKIFRVFEERSRFKMSNEENETLSRETLNFNLEEETRDSFQSQIGLHTKVQTSISKETKVTKWSKLDFTHTIQTKSCLMEKVEIQEDIVVPQSEMTTDLEDTETLHDLEEEFEADNFDACTKYEIISTDSPNIISRGRSTTRKITSKNFTFGAPLGDSEASTSFNRPTPNATRMLNFEESFEFTSPAIKKPPSSNLSVKKSLKFSEASNLSITDNDSCISSSISSPASSRMRLFPSESSTSIESGFISEVDEQFLENEETNSPKVRDLISSQITVPHKNGRPVLHRSITYHPERNTKVCLSSILESSNKEKRSQKRAEPSDDESFSCKRLKSECSLVQNQRPVLHRAFSENNATIMTALARSMSDPDLIGDFSLPFALPLTEGSQSDLKYISCDTLVGLLKGEFRDSISEFQVIDCRYPYEYDGGHILGAVNMYTCDQVLSLVNKPLQMRESHEKRSILVFHCEFSLERGPKLSRFLRSSDRAKNQENYPYLNHPEVYLLHEGYHAFYIRHPDMCSPSGYTAMLDPKHKHLLRHHRSFQLPTIYTHHKRHRLDF